MKTRKVLRKKESHSDRTVTWDKPHDVSPIDAAFPANVVGTLLPLMADIPEEFHSDHNKWCELVSQLFFLGGKLPKVQAGIDPAKAKTHLSAVLGSYQPKHEHKTAGAAWLMSMWYEFPESKTK